MDRTEKVTCELAYKIYQRKKKEQNQTQTLCVSILQLRMWENSHSRGRK